MGLEDSLTCSKGPSAYYSTDIMFQEAVTCSDRKILNAIFPFNLIQVHATTNNAIVKGLIIPFKENK
jgi:hypothetical protein